jgi:hypothetical protein
MLRPPRSIVRPRLLVAGALAGAGAISCGASIQVVYEGDVRFEHCMALDSRPDVKPTIRRACWEGWVKFYTFGQTRDRIDYARKREQQLSAASDFDEADWVPPQTGAPIAAPDPTSAFAPPPMMLGNDGGPPDAAAPVPDERQACTADCQQSLDACRHACKTAPCEKACSGYYKRCTKRCK